METAVVRFNARHPYLLFDEHAIPWVRGRANSQSKLITRLKTSLSEVGSNSTKQELRARIKRQARCLIHTAFLALISDGETKADALYATRTALAQLSAERSWKARPVIKSFLDCAEIAVAVSLAYDWLYHEFSDQERRMFENSLFRHVLAPALAAWEDRFAQWPRRRDNCTLVSNSGILVSALAVLHRYPDISRQLIQKALVSSWNAFDGLAPDGAWPEGPSYWSLAMRYAGLMVAALESTLHYSFGLADRPGFAQTGDFALHAVGPFGAAFNFGDSEPRFDMAPLAWFAYRFRRPIDAWLVDQYDGWYLPFTVIWADRPKPKPSGIKVPTGKVFHSNIWHAFAIRGRATQRHIRSIWPSRVEMALVPERAHRRFPKTSFCTTRRMPGVSSSMARDNGGSSISGLTITTCRVILIMASITDQDLVGVTTGRRLPATTPWSSMVATKYPTHPRRSSAIASTGTANGQFSICPRLMENRRAPFGVELH